AFKAYGSAIEVVAAGIAFQEAPLEAALLGTWEWSTTGPDLGSNLPRTTSTRRITLTADGRFSEYRYGLSPKSDFLKEERVKGRAIRRGNVLTFHYEDGRAWSVVYQV